MKGNEKIVAAGGGFRRLKSFRVARLVYDVTERFCRRYIDRRSRTRDQMVQAARSGVQNIAEGSQAAGTSRKIEMKLTGIARASLEELRLDYEDFLRQRGLPQWPRQDPRRQALIDRRPESLDDFVAWVHHEHARSNSPSTSLSTSPSTPLSTRATPRATHSEIAANGALVLINVACVLLDRQLRAQARQFEREGGFTERLYRIRRQRRGY